MSILPILAIVEKSKGLGEETGEVVPEEHEVKQIVLVLKRNQALARDLREDRRDLIFVVQELVRLLHSAIFVDHGCLVVSQLLNCRREVQLCRFPF